MRATRDVECLAVRDLNLQRASDIDIFLAARAAGAFVVTKDADFAALVGQHGPPPQVVLVTCGNTSNTRLREVVGAVPTNIAQPLAPVSALPSSARPPPRCSAHT